MVEGTYSSSSWPVDQNQDIVTALGKIRAFSIISISSNLFGLVAFIILVLSIGVILRDISSTSKLLTLGGVTIIAVVVVSFVGVILNLVSFVYLRSGYRLLKKSSERFNSPYMGINLYFVGLVLIVVAVLLVIGGVLANSIALVLAGIAMAIVAAILSLIGQVLGLIVGSFRLRDHFNDSTFGAAGIMFIIGIFFALFSFIGAILVYLGVNSTMKRIQQPVNTL